MSFYNVTKCEDGSIVVFSDNRQISNGTIHPMLLKVLGEEAFIEMLKQEDEDDNSEPK